MVDNSSITVDKEGRVVAYDGKDGVELFRIRTLASSLRLFAATGIIPTRGITYSKMLRMAEKYTGKNYRVRREECGRAAGDLDVLASTLVAALPVNKR